MQRNSKWAVANESTKPEQGVVILQLQRWPIVISRSEQHTSTGWAKKVIPLVHYITLYERYHFFGSPCIKTTNETVSHKPLHKPTTHGNTRTSCHNFKRLFTKKNVNTSQKQQINIRQRDFILLYVNRWFVVLSSVLYSRVSTSYGYEI